MTKYLVQQGTDFAPVYWNSKFETSMFEITDELLSSAWTNPTEPTRLRNLWNSYGNYKCVFKVVAVETES